MTYELKAGIAGAVSLSLLALAGCGGGPTTGSTDFAAAPVVVELERGEAATVDGLRIRFETVSEDSRCAVDVVCVWAGNAAVGLELSRDGGPAERVTVNTGVEPLSIVRDGLEIRITELRPDPVSTERIDPEDYRVSLDVSRVGLQ
ncbi:MAG: hypothetical protein R3195_03700 [Gemmatimonadota bacterium]|nr:hypothetical protein [Gemmatimonadota bacterium]